MKKLLLALSLLAVIGTAQAHEGFRGGYYRGGCYGCGWVAPAVIGYELSRPRYYETPTVIVQQPPVVYTQQPQPYVQSAPVGMHWQEMIDPATGVRKIVAVPN